MIIIAETIRSTSLIINRNLKIINNYSYYNSFPIKPYI